MTQADLFSDPNCGRMHVDDQRRRLTERLGRLDTKLDQDCPLCGQRVKLYRRKLDATMAGALCWLVREIPRDSNEWRSFTKQGPRWLASGGGEMAKLKYWGLIEERTNEDTAKRTSGWWRPTAAGREFARGLRRAPSHAFIFNGECQGFSTKTITIHDALGSKFDYAELMQGGSR